MFNSSINIQVFWHMLALCLSVTFLSFSLLIPAICLSRLTFLFALTTDEYSSHPFNDCALFCWVCSYIHPNLFTYLIMLSPMLTIDGCSCHPLDNISLFFVGLTFSYLVVWIFNLCFHVPFLVIVGEIANFAAYGFAPAILVTPLGALSIIFRYETLKLCSLKPSVNSSSS